MRRKCVLSVMLTLMLAACVRGQTSSASKAEIQHQNQLRQEIANLVEGQDVIVRVYPDPENDPARFDKINVPIEKLAINHDTIKRIYPALSDSSYIVFWNEDQTDEVVALVLDQQVYAKPYRKGFVQYLLPIRSAPSNVPYWTFLDALGDPIPGASVEVQISLEDGSGGLFLYEAKTNPEGRLKSRSPDRHFLFRIGHPDYGLAMATPPRPRDSASGIYMAPFLPKDAKENALSISGTVQDESGNIVPEAIIYYEQTIGPNGGILRPQPWFLAQTITNEQGWFSLYMPIDPDVLTAKGLPLQGIRYKVMVLPPSRSGLRTLKDTCILAGTEATITLDTLETSGTFHTFSFEYHEGPVTDLQELSQTVLSLSRGGGKQIKLTYDEFKAGCTLPPGDLSAFTTRWDQRFYFGTIRLTDNSPEHLIFQAPSARVYNGQVVDAKTGKPMPNILVLANHGWARFDPCSLNERQWELLDKEAQRQRDDHSPEMLCKTRDRVVKTDVEGCYELVFTPSFEKPTWNFTAMIPDYPRQTVTSESWIEPDADGMIELPPIEVREPIIQPPIPKYFPRLVFEDEEGPVTDPTKLSKILIRIETSSGQTKSQSFSIFLHRKNAPPGIYSAKAVWDGKRYTFGSIDLTSDQPETIIFKPVDIHVMGEILFQGQIVNGLTGQPIPGIFITQGHLKEQYDPSGFQAKEWAAAKTLGPNPDPASLAMAPFLELFAHHSNTPCLWAQTDTKGWFSLAIPEALLKWTDPLWILGENFMVVCQELMGYDSPLFEANNGVVTLPRIELFPAATIMIHPVVPVMDALEPPDLRLCWHIDDETASSQLIQSLENPLENHMARILKQRDLKPNITQSVYVPAGVDLTLMMYNLSIGLPPTPLNQIHLKQGQVHDVGYVENQEALEVTVYIVDRKDNPIAKTPLYCVTENLTAWETAKSTTMSGKVRVMVPPHSTGKLFVQVYDVLSGHYTREEMPYTVGGEEDAGREFIFRLSDRMVELLTQNRR